MAVNLANEKKYLEGLAAKGGGSATWANSQAAKYGITLGAVPQTTPTATPTVAQPMAATTKAATTGAVPNTPVNPTTPVTPMAASTGTPAMQGGVPNTPAAGSQASHQAWINDPRSGQGGLDNYVAGQQTKYNAALASGDTDMINRLNEDMARVGYTLTNPNEVKAQALPSGGYMPQDAVTSVRSSSELQQQSGDSLAIERAALKNAIDTQIASIKNNAQYANQLTNDGRALQDFTRTQSANPFSNMGKRSYEEGLIGRQRSIDDNSRNAELNNQLNSLSNEIANFDKLAPERQRQIYNELLQLERNFGLNVGQLTGQYGGQQTLAAKTADQNYQLGLAGLSGQLPGGGQTLAAKQQDYNQMADTRNYDRGVIESDRAYDYQQGRDTVADEQWTKEFAERVKQSGIQNALAWAQNSISKQNADTAASNAAWARDATNPDNIYKNTQIEVLRKEIDGASGDMKKELEGLYSGLSSGQITPTEALSEVEGRLRNGLTSNEEATKLKSFIQSYLEGGSSTGSSKPQVPSNDLSSLSNEELLKAWETDPTGKAAGRAKFDWRSWITDPRGYNAGLTYELWKSKYGPTLGG